MAATGSTAEETAADHQGVVFELGDTSYCLDITAVDEIVERGTLTPLPNTAPHFEGVMDLRGETTTIFNPRSYFDIDDGGGGDRILILDREDGNVGWIVDSVDRVIEYTEDAVESDMSDGAVKGVLQRDDEFIVLVDPSVVDDTNE